MTKLVENKIITRKYYETMTDGSGNIGKFIATGIWSDGHLAYSRVDENGNIIDGEEGHYVQLRSVNGHLFMQGI